MSVTVAEEGNRRIGGPDADEVTQCVLDIKSWFKRSGEWDEEGRACTSADLQRLEKTIDLELPKALSALLKEQDGGLWFMDKQSYSAARIAEVVSDNERSKSWKRGLLPFAGDDSCLQVIDTDSGGEVFEWEDETGLGDKLSASLGTFLETYRNQLLSGQFEYLDGCGVIEKVGSSSKTRK